jgi:molybdate transport system permease protein
VDLEPISLTLRLAVVTTVVLVAVSTPLAHYLAFSKPGRLGVVLESTVSLPLVLPPTVLGFYLLVLLGPRGLVGHAWEGLGGDRLVFSFSGLVIGSVLYSLPFVVQPLTQAFRAVDRRVVEAAATLGAGPLDRFLTVVAPLSRRGFLTGATLGFTHTVGEFGVVLMIGGSIPGRTRVLSVAIYDHVEAGRYHDAHVLSAGMLALSFVVILLVTVVTTRRAPS